jgi:hypothetical protein
MIGVSYPDKYAVEETFQLLKVPWEWYDPAGEYDVVLAERSQLERDDIPVIDLAQDDIFRRVSDTLNLGLAHNHEPTVDMTLDWLRSSLREHTLLVEIPPIPWDHPYMVALTHDVDLISARERGWPSVGFAAYRCLQKRGLREAWGFILAKCGAGRDPWNLFSRWKELEDSLGVRSTFFLLPFPDKPGISAPAIRAGKYSLKDAPIPELIRDGWEIGVHGIDNWAREQAGKEEMDALGRKDAGNRVHWLIFDENSWKKLDKAGYAYDSTLGYDDDVGFRAGTLQVYRPRGVNTLLELPLHIQDLGLFGKFCWAPSGGGWQRTPCLGLTEPEARIQCDRIFGLARKYGGAVTLLWHYENLTLPRDWSAFYTDLVNRAKTDGAWITTAGNIVAWFRQRRNLKVRCRTENGRISITTEGMPVESSLPPFTIRVHVPADRNVTANARFIRRGGYIDIRLEKNTVTVSLV